MKKLISILLVLSMIFGICGIYASADEPIVGGKTQEDTDTAEQKTDFSVFPESEHDYQNNFEYTWFYEHPEEVEGLFVTFSADTYTEPPTYPDYYDPSEYETYEYKAGDYLSLYRGDYYDFMGSFHGDELASKTIYFPGSSFTIELYTDESITAYGFKIDRIDTTLPEGVNAVCYNTDDDSGDVSKYYKCYSPGEEVIAFETSRFRNGNQYRYGWALSPGGELAYEDEEIIITEETVLNLYPVWANLSISSDEVYSFTNSSNYFDVVDDNDSVNYYMTLDNYCTMIGNVLKSGGLGPMPILILAAILSTLPNWNFNGSCYGMSSSVFLQHHGAIDMLSLQKNAETMNDIRPSSTIISAINYYQSQSATSYLCENLAPKAGTKNYKTQIKNMFESVSSGNPVLLSYYTKKYLIETGHSVVLTGAYTDKQGNHILLAYDPNYYNYAESHVEKFEISPDFSSIEKSGKQITFNWTDDYKHFEAFKIDGEVSPMLWYELFFSQIYRWFITFFESFTKSF